MEGSGSNNSLMMLSGECVCVRVRASFSFLYSPDKHGVSEEILPIELVSLPGQCVVVLVTRLHGCLNEQQVEHVPLKPQ